MEIFMPRLAPQLAAESLPQKILAPGSHLPDGGEGYSVLSEEEAKKKAQESSYSPFDDIKVFDED